MEGVHSEYLDASGKESSKTHEYSYAKNLLHCFLLEHMHDFVDLAETCMGNNSKKYV